MNGSLHKTHYFKISNLVLITLAWVRPKIGTVVCQITAQCEEPVTHFCHRCRARDRNWGKFSAALRKFGNRVIQVSWARGFGDGAFLTNPLIQTGGVDFKDTGLKSEKRQNGGKVAFFFFLQNCVLQVNPLSESVIKEKPFPLTEGWISVILITKCVFLQFAQILNWLPPVLFFFFFGGSICFCVTSTLTKCLFSVGNGSDCLSQLCNTAKSCKSKFCSGDFFFFFYTSLYLEEGFKDSEGWNASQISCKPIRFNINT